MRNRLPVERVTDLQRVGPEAKESNDVESSTGDNACQVCGQPVRVRILEGYAEGQPVFRKYCFECADRFCGEPIPKDQEKPAQRLSIPSMVILAGLIIVLLGASGDYLGIRGRSGFGWYQQLVIGLSVLLVVLGALFRADAVAIIGAIAFVISAGADLLGLDGSVGIGWKQELGIGIGLLLIGSGLWLRRRNRRNDADQPG